MRVADDDICLVLLEQFVPATILVPWILWELSNSFLQRRNIDTGVGFCVLAKRTMTRQRIFGAPEDD